MAYIVSARKYRPLTFEDVVGQDQITNTLKRAIESDHLAQAFLFCGPRGVGKTTCARILAKAVNTGKTEKLHEIEEDFSFNIFELDAASNNKVDDMHSLMAQVRIPPQTGKYKIYIIDEVHMLSTAAFNAFLKTLEEPPPYAIFILATTEKHKILPTILSRCQIYDFRRISVPDIVLHLKDIAQQENITAEDDALHIIAEKADGALRDALSIFDRLISAAGNNLTYESAVKRGAPILAEIMGYGFSSNGEHISNPNFDGQIASLKMVLEQSQMKPEEIDYINAHATSTPIGDKYEAMAIHEIFGGEVPVSSTKSMTGHECWMAGASEVVYSMLMMQNDFIAPNINFEEADEDTKLINIINKTKQHKINAFLSNSFGFGGTNSSLIIKKFKK